MRFEFVTSNSQPNMELVYINGVLDGEFHIDTQRETYLFVPVVGERLLYRSIDYTQARGWLIDARTHALAEIILE